MLLDGDELIGEANCIPVSGMPEQWRDAFLAAFERGGEPDRVCAIAIMVPLSRRGRGLSSVLLEHMRGLAAPFGELVAPVRPTLKERHPEVSIEEYAGRAARGRIALRPLDPHARARGRRDRRHGGGGDGDRGATRDVGGLDPARAAGGR
jgi:hypothetical protein